MTGGLFQLVAYGPQDVFFSHDPEITFFKIVYRRHTNFSMEYFPQVFNTNPDFGTRTSCVISKNGDLVRKMWLDILLPKIPPFCDNITKVAWVKNIGYFIIKRLEIELYGQVVDTHYGEWLYIWNTLIRGSKKNIDPLIGNVEELIDFTDGKEPYLLHIPMSFWFNRASGLSLPLLNISSDDIKIYLELQDFDDCIITSPSHYIRVENDFVDFDKHEIIIQNDSTARFVEFDIVEKRLYYVRLSGNGFTSPEDCCDDSFDIIGCNGARVKPVVDAVEKKHVFKLPKERITLKTVVFSVEFVFIDTDERLKFRESSLQYVIEQIVFDGDKKVDGIYGKYKIAVDRPCKEQFWLIQDDNAVRNKEYFKYVTDIDEQTILVNSIERLSLRNNNYFTTVQNYQYHSAQAPKGVNMYSFALHPEELQPSGVINLAMVSDFELLIKLKNGCISETNRCKLRTYTVVQNILRVAAGITGLVFPSYRSK
jgi:hypothetical protein